MDFFALLAALGRRWYLTILLLIILVGGGTAFAVGRVAQQYKADASYSLIPPTQRQGAPSLIPSNPWWANGIPTFASVLATAMTNDATQRQVVARGGSSKYTVAPGLTNNTSTIVVVEATADTASAAAKTVGIVGTLLNDETKRLQRQANADPRAFITLQSLNAGNAPSALRGSRVRVAVAVAAVGFVLTVIIVVAVDKQLTRRKTRRRRRTRRSEEQTAPDSNGAHSEPSAALSPQSYDVGS